MLDSKHIFRICTINLVLFGNAFYQGLINIVPSQVRYMLKYEYFTFHIYIASALDILEEQVSQVSSIHINVEIVIMGDLNVDYLNRNYE